MQREESLVATEVIADLTATLAAARASAERIRNSTSGEIRGEAVAVVEAVDRGHQLTRQLLGFVNRWGDPAIAG